MPKIKKKSKEERTAESYFPIDKTDVKYAVEKSYFKPDRQSLEMVEKILDKKEKKIKRQSKARIKNKKTAAKKFSIPKIELRPESYELIITEKPQAALKISSALGNSVKRNFMGIPYYEVERHGKRIIVACAVGHLFTLKQNTSIHLKELPIFDIIWVPNYIVIKNDFTKKYYDTILKLAKNAGSLTIATDYDIEGEVIGLNIVRFICGQKDASRMKFSTLTSDELNQSYQNKSPTLNWGQAIAGETRHYLDWFYGINLSRALMNAIKTTGKFRIMSIGRVQGPTLNLIVQKERQIKDFKSQPYWQVFITVKNSHKLELKHNKDIFDKRELKKFDGLVGKTAKAETKKTEQILIPQAPFNLTNLQTEAYKFYGITPSNTLKSAQSLYLEGLISYPRTSSQKLPASIGYEKILEKLSKEYNVESFITRKKPIEGKKTDPAHPSIYPTGNKQILTGNEEKIYDLIVRRFLSLFCDNTIIDNKTITLTVNDLAFSVRGLSIRKKAWMNIYPTKLKENEIPDLDGNVKIINVKIEEKETQPPKRYSQASIISELEKRNLGTKATRANILETLYDRGYIKNKSIEATPLGISLITTLERYSNIIIDESLTRSFEQKMDSIIEAKKEQLEKEKKIINSAKKTITEIIKDFERNEPSIGKELLNANIEQREQEKIENKLKLCEVCKKGYLAITYSKKNKRFFVACDAYPKCKTTFSLPPNSLIKKTDKLCEACGWPMLMSIRSGKKPWIFCFNPNCEKNKKRIEEYNKKKRLEEYKNRDNVK